MSSSQGDLDKGGDESVSCSPSRHFILFWTPYFKRSLQRREWPGEGSQGPQRCGNDIAGKTDNETEAVNPLIE